MALRRPATDRPARLVLLREVLAELNQLDPGRVQDSEAEALASRLPAKLITRDWASRPMVPEMDAERLLLRMRRDRLQHATEQAARMTAFEQSHALQLPPGTVGVTRPGEPDWYAPGIDPRVLRGPEITERPR
jgi:hypothetical protein